MSLEIKKTEGILSQNASTPVLTGGTSSDIQITLNKHQEIPQPDKKTEEKIKFLVAALYPKVNWDELSNVEKQNFIAKFYDGTLQQEAENLKEQIATVNEKLKTLAPEEAKNYLLDLYLTKKHDGYDKKGEAEKNELRNKLAINLLDKMQKAQNEKAEENGKVIPFKKTIAELPERAQEKALARNEFKLQAIVYAYQNNKLDINSQEEMIQFFQDSANMEELEFNYASKRVNDNKEILESNKPENRTVSLTYQIGSMNREIAKNYGMELEDFLKSEDRSQMVFDYLSKKENRTEFEEKIYRVLRKQSEKLGGDLSNVKNHGTGSIEDSYLNQIFKDKEVDILNLTTEDIAQVKNQILKDLDNCKTDEEKTEVVAKILNSTRTDFESSLIHEILANLEKAGTIDADIHLNANHKCGQSSHMAVMHSAKAGEKNQIKYAKHVAAQATLENPTFSEKQAAGYTKNIIPEYEVGAQAISTNTMTDTGLQGVYDVLPETYSKLNETAAKEAYEYAMTSENISADQKAILARDTIDAFGDKKEMKEFFENIANKNNVDYNSVPPKSERINSETKATNETANNIENSKYTPLEVNNIIANSMKNSTGISSLIEAILETGNTILGKTSDPKDTSLTKITTVDSAIEMLKAGTSFAKVFNRCSEEVKKSFIKNIMQSPQKDTAIKYLLEKGIQFDTLLKCAPTANAKKNIYQIATGVHISTVKTEVEKFAAKV